MKIYYKVVDKNIALTSARMSPSYHPLIYVTYIPGQWVGPSKACGNKLFVFSTLKAAQDFRENDEEIWSCNCKSVTKKGVYAHTHSDWGVVTKALKLKAQNKRYLPTTIDARIPKDTRFASSVKLIERLV